jgi:hypothetical protein
MMGGMCMEKSKSTSWVIPVIGTYVRGYLQQQSSFFPSQTVDFIWCCVFIKKVLCHNMQQEKKNNPSVNIS